MIEGYTIREAVLDDRLFLAEAIVAAEKGNSNKLSLATLFDLPEEKVKELIIQMLGEEVDGCEFSISSFLIVQKEEIPVATVGGWTEGMSEDTPSQLLRTNLLFYTFPKDSIAAAKSKSDAISPLLISRDHFSLQIEYVYVHENHRNKKLAQWLITEHIKNSKKKYTGINKSQVQVFRNNLNAIKLYENLGYRISKTYRSNTQEVLNYMPDSEKLLMEKEI
jgi:ribosomal protein S18 acetylase RimI-like enzyme